MIIVAIRTWRPVQSGLRPSNGMTQDRAEQGFLYMAEGGGGGNHLRIYSLCPILLWQQITAATVISCSVGLSD